MTSIEWTEETWNPVRGCSLVSPGCTNCYAMRQAHRFSGKGQPYEGLTVLREKNGPVWTGAVRFVPEMLGVPLRWKRPRRVFVNSMSDLFHSEVTNDEIAAVFGVMAACPQHTFQILTKRAKRMHSWFQWVSNMMVQRPGRVVFGPLARQVCRDAAAEAGIRCMPETGLRSAWPLPNVHLLVSVEDQERADERVPLLLQTPAAVRGVSYEPALGPVRFPPCGLDWIIVGGESGPGARPFDVSWARQTIEHCSTYGIACFVKQLGAWVRGNHLEFGEGVVHRWMKSSACRSASVERQLGGGFQLCDPKGGSMDEWPEDLRVREYPRSQHAEAAQ